MLHLNIGFFLQEALDIVHVSKEDQENVFAILAAVLWLGNVTFSIVDNDNHAEPVINEGNSFQKSIIASIMQQFLTLHDPNTSPSVLVRYKH